MAKKGVERNQSILKASRPVGMGLAPEEVSNHRAKVVKNEGMVTVRRMLQISKEVIGQKRDGTCGVVECENRAPRSSRKVAELLLR